MGGCPRTRPQSFHGAAWSWIEVLLAVSPSSRAVRRVTRNQRRTESPADTATAAIKNDRAGVTRAPPPMCTLSPAHNFPISSGVEIVIEKYLLSVAFSTHSTTMQAVCRACNSLKCFVAASVALFSPPQALSEWSRPLIDSQKHLIRTAEAGRTQEQNPD